MGFPVSPGLNVPAWLVDAAELDVLLTRLQRALERPPSFSTSLNPSLLGFDRTTVRDSVTSVADAAKSAHVELRHALAEFKTHTIDRAHQERLTAVVNELTTLWSVRATMTLGFKRSTVLRQLLGDPAPDLLGILQREDDENSHSAVLRWLLDPRKAPALAPVALRCLVSRFPEPEAWRTALRDGMALGCVNVRREVVIGHDLDESGNKDRIDLVVSGPDFVIGGVSPRARRLPPRSADGRLPARRARACRVPPHPQAPHSPRGVQRHSQHRRDIMSGLSEVSRLFAGRAGDLEKAREIFTAETRSYVSPIEYGSHPACTISW
jgi:hypothetical protein